ncbi:hypothetical protein [Arthrobacter cryoconiti]|uniref:ABC transporter permease n=1 Tax=Arthrobacter cryoconiti TaxID=748907 RepID=A0ABV8R0M6_9MICC|nr:hypothetical protein [Arthrobacter cryoconiti]MCC9068667.1 hypothetical protein [Arthrobacter cryoconiti]
MTFTPDRLRSVRAVYRRRGDGRTRGDITYAVYVGFLALLTVAAPWCWGIGLTLAQPSLLSILTDPNADHMVGVVCGLVLAGLAASGAVRGPALLSPFFTAVLAGNDLPRSRTLRRPFIQSAALLTGILMGVALLASTVPVTTGIASAWNGMAFVAAAGCFGVLGSVTWLSGQVLGDKHAGRLTAGLLIASLFTWTIPTLGVLAPWGWVGRLWMTGSSVNLWVLAGLLLVTAAAAMRVSKLLNSLTGTALMDQSLRWQAAGVSAFVGDAAAAALGSFRAQPQWGRTWPAATCNHAAVRFFVRDFIGTLRTPKRFMTGIIFLLLGNLTLVLGPSLLGMPAWLLGGMGGGLCYLALGVFSDGFRHAAEAASAPPLYKYSNTQLYALHAVFPLVVTLACSVIVTASVAVTGVPVSAAAVGISVLIVIVRAYDSAKSPLPVSLLTPMPSQFGDMSTVTVLAWQADALLVSLAAGAGLLALTSSGSLLAATTLLAGAALVILATTKRRIRSQ